MGYDLIAYFDIDQDDIEKFISGATDVDKTPAIVQYFLDTYVDNEDDKDYLRKWGLYYEWDDEMEIHKIETSHPSSFIRDDTRLSSLYYQKQLEKKVGKPFPYILGDMNWYIREPEHAEEAAAAIYDFFPDDTSLMGFRKWLLITSKYALCYELSR